MLRFITILIHTFVRAIFVLALAVCACAAAEPTLARLSFWIPSERMAQFEAIYETQVVPILEKHGMRASSEQGRATVDSVFARLFEFEGTGELSEKGRALEEGVRVFINVPDRSTF